MATGLSVTLGQAQVFAQSRALLNALTIDVEEPFHSAHLAPSVPRSHWDRLEARVEVGTHHLLDLLDEAGVRATFFVLGWVAQRHPALVQRIQRQGHEIASHGCDHEPLDSLTPELFRQDLRRSRQVLEDLAGKPVTLYRAPGFSIGPRTLWALDVLIEEAYQLDASIDPCRRGFVGAPQEPCRIERAGGHIWEFPRPVWPILGWPLPIGGASFRCLPYALTRRGLQTVNASGRPFAFALHSWEFDAGQPRLRPGFLRGLRHYVNLRHTADRLRRLLHDFAFGTITQALDRLAGETLLPTHSFIQAA